MKIAATMAAAAASLTIASPASAQFAKPEDAVKYRQNALFVMGQHFGRIGAMVNGKAPYDAKAAVENAEVIASLARLPWAGFAPGTEKASSTNRAKPEVWSDQAKFKDHADKFLGEAPKLLAAAKTNNLDTLKGAFGPAANSCKACHDAFRKD
jgi:cytochrome c556